MQELDAYERRFRRAGLPLLIEGWSAREDALPRDLGPPELAAFVVLPALLPLLFGGQATSALVTAVANLVLVALVAVGFGFGVLAILTWALRRVAGQLATSLLLLARAVPLLLLLFAVVLFLTTEMWQTFAQIDDASLVAVAALLVAVGTLFLLVRLPREVEALEREAGSGPPLTRPQRLNVGLVMLVSQGLQVLIVSVAIGAFFVAFGLLVVGPEQLQAWIQTDGHRVGPRALGLTLELLRVSAAIAALAGLYYAIAVLTDATYREEFLEEITAELRETFAARVEYLARRATVQP